MKWLLDFDELICKKFDNFRALINRDSVWLALFIILMIFLVVVSFYIGGLTNGLSWIVLSSVYLFSFDWWEAAKSKDLYNFKRDDTSSIVRIFLLFFGLLYAVIGDITLLLLALAFYVASAHKLK